MKKVLIVASVASMISQFNMPNLKLLKELNYEVHIACNFEKGNTCDKESVKKLIENLKVMDIRYFQIDFVRNVFDLRQNKKAYIQIYKLLNDEKYAFLHCHSPIGGVIGRLAAAKTRTKVIYTAHGFHFYKGAPLKNWIFYYPVERFLAKYTDVLITINYEDYQIAKKLGARRVEYVHGVGIDLDCFSEGDEVDIKEKRRKKLGIANEIIMILSVGELSERKNHEPVINAINLINNPSVKYYICGQGEKREHYEKIIKKQHLESQIFLLGYRKDILEICQAADLFVFPSLQEGLPVALMEAMAAGLPVVASKIRGNTDLVIEKKGGFMLNLPKDTRLLSLCMKKLVDNEQLRKSMGEYNRKRIRKFEISNVNETMKNIYKCVN